jgi:hypothetical protein
MSKDDLTDRLSDEDATQLIQSIEEAERDEAKSQQKASSKPDDKAT